MRRALVVHRDPKLRKAMALDLASSYTPVLASSAEEAHLALSTGEPMLAIVVDLDTDDGDEALDILRESRRALPDAVRVLISSLDGEKLAGKALETKLASCYVRKPLREGAVVEAIRHVRREAQSRVLIADDDRGFCERVAEWLGERHKVLVAHDGETALRMAKEMRPDIVLLDFNMPKLAGCSVAWAFRADDRLHGIPVINMTEGDDHKRLLADEAYLTKPFSKTDLLGLIVHLSRFPTPQGIGVVDERRLIPRIDVDMTARLVAHAKGTPGTLLNLSPCGAFFACERELAPGTPAWLSFSTDVGQFEGGCEVLYVAEVGGRRGVALRFFEQPVENQEIVVKALAACTTD